MFRRILSPHRNRDVERERQNQSRRSYTAGTVQSNGHETANNSDEITRIENTAYGDPDIVAVTGENPPLPPRNLRPASVGHSFQVSQRGDDESPVYVAPADTLVRKTVMSPSIYTPPAETQVPGGDVGVVPTKTEKKKMQMHQLTMSQKRDQDPGHSRTRSVGHVIDSSDYSTPFDLQQQLRREKGKGGHSISVPGLPPPKPPHSRVRQVTGIAGDDNELIIPVMSPPPVILSDRDQSISPSSPLSTPSSEHEIPEYPPDDGTNDYDEPWDRKFRNLQFTRQRRRPDNEDFDQQHHHHNHFRDSPPHLHHHHQTHEDVQLRGSMRERASSPAFELRGKSVSARELGGGTSGSRIRKISPQPPEVPADLNRPQLPRRTKGRDGSTSPIQGGGVGSSRVQQMPQFQSRSYSQSQSYRRELSNDFAPEINPRTSSVSMSNRRLPSPPGELPPPIPLSQPPPPIGDWRSSRNASPPTSMIIDTSIPLTDQP